MKTSIATIGALLSVGGVVGLYFAFGFSWLALGVLVGVILLSYILAAIGGMSGFGEFMRGWLIGLNAAVNGFVGATLFGSLLGFVGLIIGVVLGLFNLISVFKAVSQSEVYQGFLGWFNWFMPMSWLVVGLGFLFYFSNLLGHLIVYLIFRVQYFRILGLRADWKTGTFFMRSGFISNLNPIDTAFNMGNFSFVDKQSAVWHIAHEAGHTLNLGAFGSVFHLIGALDENATGRGSNAYSERLAESNSSGSSGNNIPMWM